MKTAIIHEWLVNYAGSERVLEQIVRLYPDADLFCQVDFLSDDEKGFIRKKFNPRIIDIAIVPICYNFIILFFYARI